MCRWSIHFHFETMYVSPRTSINFTFIYPSIPVVPSPAHKYQSVDSRCFVIFVHVPRYPWCVQGTSSRHFCEALAYPLKRFGQRAHLLKKGRERSAREEERGERGSVVVTWEECAGTWGGEVGIRHFL